MEIRRRSPSPKIRVSYLEYGVPHDDEKPRNILEKIVWEKDREIDLARQKVPLDQLKKKIKILVTRNIFNSHSTLEEWSNILLSVTAHPITPKSIVYLMSMKPATFFLKKVTSGFTSICHGAGTQIVLFATSPVKAPFSMA